MFGLNYWQPRSRLAYALARIWPPAIRFAAQADKDRWHRVACDDDHCPSCRSYYGLSVLQSIRPSQRDWHIQDGVPLAYAVKPAVMAFTPPNLDDVLQADYYSDWRFATN